MTTITIRNSTTTYNNMFVEAATTEGTKITVNYTPDTSELVTNMVVTKSDNSNVVKRDLVE